MQIRTIRNFARHRPAVSYRTATPAFRAPILGVRTTWLAGFAVVAALTGCQAPTVSRDHYTTDEALAVLEKTLRSQPHFDEVRVDAKRFMVNIPFEGPISIMHEVVYAQITEAVAVNHNGPRLQVIDKTGKRQRIKLTTMADARRAADAVRALSQAARR